MAGCLLTSCNTDEDSTCSREADFGICAVKSWGTPCYFLCRCVSIERTNQTAEDICSTWCLVAEADLSRTLARPLSAPENTNNQVQDEISSAGRLNTLEQLYLCAVDHLRRTLHYQTDSSSSIQSAVSYASAAALPQRPC